MTLLFNRKYTLTIGLPDRFPEVPRSIALKEAFTATEWQSGSDWLKTTVEGTAVEITDLQVIANIRSTSNSSNSSTSTTVKIYNMASSTRDIVERINNYIILQAGYEQDEELTMVFSGQVTDFETTREGQNLVTTLKCSDAYSPNNSVRVSKNFKKDQTYSEVIQYFIEAYAENGVPLGDFVDDWGSTIDPSTRSVSANDSVVTANAEPQNYIQLPVITNRPSNTRLLNGYSAVGYLHQVLNNICKQIGYVSYITNGQLFIHPKGFTKMVEQFEFTSDQIKSIRKLGSQTTNSSLGKGIEGVKIKTFLDGRLDIDKRVKILDGDYAGTYKIITKEHNLDYEVGAWDTIITCKEDTT